MDDYQSCRSSGSQCVCIVKMLKDYKAVLNAWYIMMYWLTWRKLFFFNQMGWRDDKSSIFSKGFTEWLGRVCTVKMWEMGTFLSEKCVVLRIKVLWALDWRQVNKYWFHSFRNFVHFQADVTVKHPWLDASWNLTGDFWLGGSVQGKLHSFGHLWHQFTYSFDGRCACQTQVLGMYVTCFFCFFLICLLFGMVCILKCFCLFVLIKHLVAETRSWYCMMSLCTENVETFCITAEVVQCVYNGLLWHAFTKQCNTCKLVQSCMNIQSNAHIHIHSFHGHDSVT